MKGLDVGFERLCRFEAGSMCTGNHKLVPRVVLLGITY